MLAYVPPIAAITPLTARIAFPGSGRFGPAVPPPPARLSWSIVEPFPLPCAADLGTAAFVGKVSAVANSLKSQVSSRWRADRPGHRRARETR